MKNQKEKSTDSFREDYQKMIERAEEYGVIQHEYAPQWINKSDQLVKFSLYTETPFSIASTDSIVFSDPLSQF